jgi:hypothetical protein
LVIRALAEKEWEKKKENGERIIIEVQ